MKNAMIVGHAEMRELFNVARMHLRKGKNGEEVTVADRNRLARAMKAVKTSTPEGLLAKKS